MGCLVHAGRRSEDRRPCFFQRSRALAYPASRLEDPSGECTTGHKARSRRQCSPYSGPVHILLISPGAGPPVSGPWRPCSSQPDSHMQAGGTLGIGHGRLEHRAAEKTWAKLDLRSCVCRWREELPRRVDRGARAHQLCGWAASGRFAPSRRRSFVTRATSDRRPLDRGPHRSRTGAQSGRRTP